MLCPVDEELLEELEIREGQPIGRTERVPCTIALAKVHPPHPPLSQGACAGWLAICTPGYLHCDVWHN